MSDANPPQFPSPGGALPDQPTVPPAAAPTLPLPGPPLQPSESPPYAGQPLPGPPGQPAPGQPYGAPQPGYPPQQWGTPQPTNGMAIAALVCGILGFVSGLTAVGGVAFGHVALSQIKRDPHQQGKGMAIAGLVCGYIVLAIILLYILIIVALVGAWASST